MEYMHVGGGIMWIILGLSVAALAVAIERLLFFAGASTNAEALERAFAEALAEGDDKRARSVADGRSSMHRLFAAAYSHWGLDRENLTLLIEQRIRRELYRWGRGLPALGIVARAAPLLGLLGTVLGMVQMFQSLDVGGGIDPQAVTGGIWKALFTTVAGLSVAIPTIIVHGLFEAAIDREEETLKSGADFLIREHFESSSRTFASPRAGDGGVFRT